ncbi:MAG: hypothetical protein H0U76_29670 [Ktedonobacteraceae bacterium]|nr:hypothetical protein [Ktedonobacteraceae bacterium]
MASNRGSNVPLNSLRRLMQTPPRQVVALEHCDLCQEVLAPDHRHLLELSSRTLICACTACFLLFNKEGSGRGKYRTVPRRFLTLPDFVMSDGEWDDLMIPVNMVFMYRSAGNKPVTAFYPGPAGATESQLSLDNWSILVQNNPILETLEHDVEALLIYRVRGVREYYVVPIDVCYELVGLIRRSWRGLSGGEVVWKNITDFFGRIRAQARLVTSEKKVELGEREKGGTDARAEL